MNIDEARSDVLRALRGPSGGDAGDIEARLDDFAAALSQYAFRFSTERELQLGVFHALGEQRLCRAHLEARVCPATRLDILTRDGIGIEIKVRGSMAEVAGQVQRYLECADVRAMIVVTTRRQHAELPATLCGKPVRVFVVTSALS